MKKRNRLLTATLATAVVASVSIQAPVEAAVVFPDVKADSTHFGPIHALAEAGVVSGFPDGTYRPNEAITRGQAAKILAGVLQLNTQNVQNPQFRDVSPTHQYYGAIAALTQAGIISGFEDGTYRPSATITRGHMAKMMVEGLRLPATGSVSNFTDVPATNQYKSYVDVLLAYGITKGQPDGSTTFGVNNAVTRGQMATFIARAKAALQPPEPSAKAIDVTIMHQNDTHARLDAVAKTVTTVKEVRAQKEHTLLLHAGDVFSGTLYFNEFYGQADVAFMNLMGVDAFVFGNHEFDLGSSATGHKGLADFLAVAKFPTVAANVDASKDTHLAPLQSRTVSASPTDGRIYDAVIQTIDGEKVGIFGLTTAETADISSPGSVVFENYIEAAKATVTKLEAQGVNKIIALTHIGYDDNVNVDNDQQLAKLVAGIDVIVGGHTHTQLDVPVAVAAANDADDEPTIIVQAYQHNDFLGTLDVSFDKDGVITAHNGELLKIADRADDAQAVALLQPYKDKIGEIANEQIGVTLANELSNPRLSEDGSGSSVRANETILGNLITEGMLEKAKTIDEDVVMAFQNGGGIRASINAGEVTVGEVISVLPFGNTLALAEVTGEELYKTFEHALKEVPKESGGFLHVAGARVTYDASKPAGSRVVSIETRNGETYTLLPNSNARYMIATNAFTAKGGDGFADLGKAYADGRVQDLGLSDWENFRDYLVREKDRIPTAVRGTVVPIQ